MSIDAERVRRGAGKYPQSVALLARLRVDSRHEGRGLGAGLLKDVLPRFAAVAEEIGTRALLIHAESETARGYGLHLLPDLTDRPTPCTSSCSPRTSDAPCTPDLTLRTSPFTPRYLRYGAAAGCRTGEYGGVQKRGWIRSRRPVSAARM